MYLRIIYILVSSKAVPALYVIPHPSIIIIGRYWQRESSLKAIDILDLHSAWSRLTLSFVQQKSCCCGSFYQRTCICFSFGDIWIGEESKSNLGPSHCQLPVTAIISGHQMPDEQAFPACSHHPNTCREQPTSSGHNCNNTTNTTLDRLAIAGQRDFKGFLY